MKIEVRRALVSVYDKTGLEELARGLHEAGVEIVSTGSTAAAIQTAGVPVTPVEQVTGFPEIMGGRVKTLHPHIHGGLLADQGDPEHVATIDELGIAAFQLLVSNLYPFRETVAGGAAPGEVIEQIDIGGPAMVRASAKNHGSVAVVTDPARYGDVLDAVRGGGFELEQRQALARDAFRHTAAYDIAVASWLGNVVAPDDSVEDAPSGFPGWIAANYERAAVLRYGENPHQRAALYVTPGQTDGLANAEQVSGAADELQQLRRRRRRLAGRLRLRRALRGDHQARQSVWDRGRHRHRRRPRQGPRVRPGQRLRRRHRHQRHGHRGVLRPDRQGTDRGRRRARRTSRPRSSG